VVSNNVIVIDRDRGSRLLPRMLRPPRARRLGVPARARLHLREPLHAGPAHTAGLVEGPAQS
jgi:hypothetical protein